MTDSAEHVLVVQQALQYYDYSLVNCKVPPLNSPLLPWALTPPLLLIVGSDLNGVEVVSNFYRVYNFSVNVIWLRFTLNVSACASLTNRVLSYNAYAVY